MIKLHDSIWIVSNENMHAVRDGFFPFSESLKLDPGEYMTYDFFLHILKSLELDDAGFVLKISDLTAKYSTNFLRVYRSTLQEELGKLIPYPCKIGEEFYPRMRLNKGTTKFPELNLGKFTCNCQRPDRTLNNGSYGLYIRCASCKKNKSLREFIE